MTWLVIALAGLFGTSVVLGGALIAAGACELWCASLIEKVRAWTGGFPKPHPLDPTTRGLFYIAIGWNAFSVGIIEPLGMTVGRSPGRTGLLIGLAVMSVFLFNLLLLLAYPRIANRVRRYRDTAIR